MQEVIPNRYGIAPAGILVISTLAVIYALYIGREVLLPLALAIVLKLLLQPVMRLLRDRLRFPGPLAALTSDYRRWPAKISSQALMINSYRRSSSRLSV